MDLLACCDQQVASKEGFLTKQGAIHKVIVVSWICWTFCFQCVKKILTKKNRLCEDAIVPHLFKFTYWMVLFQLSLELEETMVCHK